MIDFYIEYIQYKPTTFGLQNSETWVQFDENYENCLFDLHWMPSWSYWPLRISWEAPRAGTRWTGRWVSAVPMAEAAFRCRCPHRRRSLPRVLRRRSLRPRIRWQSHNSFYNMILRGFSKFDSFVLRVLPNCGQCLLRLLCDGVGVVGLNSAREELRTPEVLG